MSDTARREVQIQWVVFDGEVVHVSTFAGVLPDHRPTVACPHCGDVLVLRLGRVRAWHAAHKAGASCVLAGSESALHYNTKFRLQQLLQLASAILLRDACAARGRPSSGCTGRVRTWLQDWDHIEVERAVGSVRPDLTVWRGGAVVGAIEVLVTHEVGPEKEATLKALGVPWVEVAAAMLPDAWASTDPLPCRRVVPDVPYTCDACVEAEAERRRLEVRSKQERLTTERRAREHTAALRLEASTLEERMRTNGVLARRLLVFDRLLDDGRVDRDGILIADMYRRGEIHSAFAGVVGAGTVLSETNHPNKSDYLSLRAASEEYLRGQRVDVDQARGWLNMTHVLVTVKGLWADDADDYRWTAAAPPPWRVAWSEPGLDSLDLLRFYYARYLSGLPVRYRWSRRDGSWFLPRGPSAGSWVLLPRATPSLDRS